MALKLSITNMMEEKAKGIDTKDYVGDSELSIEFILKLMIINHPNKLICDNPILKLVKIENLIESLKYELWTIEDYLYKNSEPSTLVWYMINTNTSTLEDLMNMYDFNEKYDFIEIESITILLGRFIGSYNLSGNRINLTFNSDNPCRVFVRNNKIGQEIKESLNSFEDFASIFHDKI